MGLSSDIWFGWIPTNRGLLNFDFISLPKYLNTKDVKIESSLKKIRFSNLNLSYLSDSYIFSKISFFSKTTELPAIANIEFENKAEGIEGKVEIIYENYCKLTSYFLCKLNGVVEFRGITYDIDNLGDFLNDFKAFIYVLVKTIIHGDAHHHQKIDVALPVMDKEFQPPLVSASLLNYIKLVERNIKISKSCESVLRNENLVFEISGYLSYFRSFNLLFDNPLVKKDYQFANSVFKSLKSTVAKRKNKKEFSESLINSLFTALGILISVNVLINGFWGPTLTEINPNLVVQDRVYLFWIIAALITVILYCYRKCKFHAYLYYNYYHLFEYFKVIKNGKIFRLGFVGLILRLTPIVFFSAFLYFSYLYLKA